MIWFYGDCGCVLCVCGWMCSESLWDEGWVRLLSVYTCTGIFLLSTVPVDALVSIAVAECVYVTQRLKSR